MSANYRFKREFYVYSVKVKTYYSIYQVKVC